MDDNSAILAAASLLFSSSSSAPELSTWFSFSVQAAMSKITTSLEVDDGKNMFFHLYLGCFPVFRSNTDRYLTDRKGGRKQRPLRYFQSLFISSVLVSIVAEGEWFLQCGPCWLQTPEADR